MQERYRDRDGVIRITNDTIGRACVEALVATGAEEEAEAWASWLTLEDMTAMLKARPRVRYWKRRTGEHISLTKAERDQYRVFALWPRDVSRQKIEQESAERKRVQGCENARTKRSRWKYQHPATIKPRHASLLAVMNIHFEPLPVVRKRVPWNGATPSLKGPAMRQASARAVRKLVAAGLVESKSVAGKRGLPVLLVRRVKRQK